MSSWEAANTNLSVQNASKDEIGDEYQYLFICNNTEIQSLRSKYIPKYYVQNSSVAKMAGIFSLCNSQLLKSVALFLKESVNYSSTLDIRVITSIHYVVFLQC